MVPMTNSGLRISNWSVVKTVPAAINSPQASKAKNRKRSVRLGRSLIAGDLAFWFKLTLHHALQIRVGF